MHGRIYGLIINPLKQNMLDLFIWFLSIVFMASAADNPNKDQSDSQAVIGFLIGLIYFSLF